MGRSTSWCGPSGTSSRWTRGPGDQQDGADRLQQPPFVQPPGEAGAEQGSGNGRGRAHREQRPVDTAAEMSEDARDAEAEADRNVRSDRAERVGADVAEQRRKA
jgi:hypothetical protein